MRTLRYHPLKPARGKRPVACHLQGAGGDLIIQAHYPPLPQLLGVLVLGSPLRTFSLLEHEGEVAVYDEVVADDPAAGKGAGKAHVDRADD